ncbi:MAG: type III secretion system chaperone [Pseudomonadota bacterium]
MQRLAADLGVAHYESGLFWFQLEGGPQIQVEPLEQGDAIALHAGFRRVPRGHENEDTTIEDLLSANAPRNGYPMWAIDPVDGQAVLFQRFDDAGIGYEELVRQVQGFAQKGAAGMTPSPERQNASAAVPTPTDAETFRLLLADLAFRHGGDPAAADTADKGGFLVATEDGGGVLIRLEPVPATVLLKSLVAFMPMDEEEMGEARTGEFLRPLLEANLLGEATGGACFAIDDEDGDGLIAYRRLPLAGLDAFTLGRSLGELMTTSARFAENLNINMPVLA